MKLIKSGIILRSKLVHNPKYKKLSLPLPEKEESLIYDDIEKKGQKEPVRIDQDFNLLDGYLRDRILGNLREGDIIYEQYHFEDESEKIDYIISLNRRRRHYTEYQKCQMAKPLYLEEKKKAEERQKSGTFQSQDRKGEAVNIAAKSAGTSGSTFKRFLDIEKSPELKKYEKDLISGNKKVKTVHVLVTRKERNLRKIPLPKKISDVFCADVPYGYEDKGGRAAAEEHFPTMSAEELIAEFKNIAAAENAIIFFWMSPSIQYSEIPIQYNNPNYSGCAVIVNVPIYKAILDAGGFKVKQEFVWDKEKIGAGNYNRNQHENLLIAIKGKMPIPAELFPSIIKKLRSAYARKPNLWPMIKKMYPKRNYCELYAREQTEGVLCHGNELKKFKTRTIINCKFCGTVCKKLIPHLKKYHKKSIDYFPVTEKIAVKYFSKTRRIPV